MYEFVKVIKLFRKISFKDSGIIFMIIIIYFYKYYYYNHNYNKIVKSDWLSTALISALIGQFNRTVRVMPK